MLNGRLIIEPADNGWVLSWNEPAPSFAGHREVFTDPHECFSRLSELTGLIGGPAAARMLLDAAQSHCHVDPATDSDVAAIAAPGTPATVPIGD